MAKTQKKGNVASEKSGERYQFKVMGNPMVRIIKARDFMQLMEEDYNIPYEAKIKTTDDFKIALKAASRISATGGVSILTDRFLTSCPKPNKPAPILLRYIQKMIDDCDADNPLMAVITNPPGCIPSSTREEAEAIEPMDKLLSALSASTSVTDATNHQFLKDPLTDDMLIEALTAAAAAMLNDEYAGRMKWKDDDDYHEKEYGLNHLLICLFYYVHVNGLNSGSKFFFHQRTQFHEYCREHLPADMNICSERYFRNCMNKLQWKSCSFDEYIQSGVKPQAEWRKGQFSVEFWYAIYRKAARHFKEKLQPRA